MNGEVRDYTIDNTDLELCDSTECSDKDACCNKRCLNEDFKIYCNSTYDIVN